MVGRLLEPAVRPTVVRREYPGSGLLCQVTKRSRVTKMSRRDVRGLFTVPDQRIVQTVLERAEPGLVVPPLEEPVAENRLADLLGACCADATFCLVELDAGRFEFKAAEFQDAPHVSLEILHEVFV